MNTSWELCPWADVLYGCDYAWWHRHDGVPRFCGLKIAGDRLVTRRPWGVQRIRVDKARDDLVLDPPGTVGWGGNSGFHAINLAVQFGARRIVLVGFDLRVDGGLHWHGKHDGRLRNPTEGNVARWRRAIDDAAPVLAAAGVEVVNASRVSALTAYPKVSFREATC